MPNVSQQAPYQLQAISKIPRTLLIGEETGGSIHHPAKNNSIVGLAPTQELVSRAGMVGAALNTRVGPLCRTVKDAARVLEVIAGYDPNDELTAFSIGRLPSEPYRSFANEQTLNGMRIGVICTSIHPSSLPASQSAISDQRPMPD